MRSSCFILGLLWACESDPDEELVGGEWYVAEREAETGWVRQSDPGGRSLFNVTDDGRAYVGTSRGMVFLEPSPGVEPLGSHGPYEGLEHELTTPLIDGSVGLIRNVRGDLLAVDLDDDSVLWRTVDHMPVLVGDPGDRVAVMQRNTLEPALLARDLLSGEVLWTIEATEEMPPILEDVSGSRICGSSNGELAVFDADLPGLLWRVEHDLMEPIQCAFQQDGVVVLGTPDGEGGGTVLRFDLDGNATARVEWPHDVAPTTLVVRSDGVVIVSSDRAMERYSSGLELLDSHDDRAVLGVDPVTGNMYLSTRGPHTLTDADFHPIWNGGVGVPRDNYAFIGAQVVEERVYWTDRQSGVLGTNRWTRYVQLR